LTVGGVDVKGRASAMPSRPSNPWLTPRPAQTSAGSRDASQIVRSGGAADASANIALALWTSGAGADSRRSSAAPSS
jgi:hypothetical protein